MNLIFHYSSCSIFKSLESQFDFAYVESRIALVVLSKTLDFRRDEKERIHRKTRRDEKVQLEKAVK